MNHLFCLGFSYTAQYVAARLDRKHWKISGTSRSAQGIGQMQGQGVTGHIFETLAAIPSDVTHVLCSIPPDAQGCPAAIGFGGAYKWIGYLSTTGVYGNHDGGWVDENTPLTPNSERAQRRVVAEAQWAKFTAHIFRLPGIYGPGRSQLDSVKDGTARRIIKPNQIFSRIHVDDIAGVLAASMHKPNLGRIYNVADDEPCPPQDVVAYAAQLLGVAPPPEMNFEDARLSPMARSFYDDSKRVSNARMKLELGVKLKYPSYREGLRAIYKSNDLPCA